MPDWGKLWTSVRTPAAEAVGFVQRGLRYAGSERDDLVLGLKTVLAATAAWVLARWLLPPTVSTFAPFTALVALQATVYRSLRDCAQYMGAMAAGAALAASLAAAAGIHGWSFALLTLLALAVGRFRPLGAHGTQVAIVGFFAYSSGQGQIGYVGHLVASVVLGAVCGIAAHLLFAPARHTLHRQEAVTGLITRIEERVDDLADTFEALEPDADEVHELREAWRQLSSEADRIRSAIDDERENSRLNPRPSIEDSASALIRARAALDIAQRCQDHLRSVSRSLDHAVSGGDVLSLSASFRCAYATLLRASATALHHIGRQDHTDRREFDTALEQAVSELEQARLQILVERDGPSGQTALQGTLLTDAGRLLEELRHHG
ncbi:aromatic acid exporter family protein [Streptomyces sp. SP18ES09]|uniref:aromatic acid exporter family protein n=1 Tax=Streptomyces sp. SP18ES09 TaxID=3002532 RepID=UPI002E75FC47|nr:aromatic acid exporter family protein [Streptomyces sp. SP18ES09]MEE1816106.1 aromatic acid exporter family protein [Streptomyces sp. SP18ES09]